MQREYLDSQIRGLSNSHIVHPDIHRQKVPMVPPHGRIKDIAVPLQVCVCVLTGMVCVRCQPKCGTTTLAELLILKYHRLRYDGVFCVELACVI